MKTIVWDVDDVLNDLMRVWLEQEWVPKHPECKLKYSDIRENPPHRIMDITREEYLESLDSFRLSSAARGMDPVPEVMGWFLENGRNFRHVALTARPVHTVGAAAEWVFRHFGAWVRGFHFVPARRTHQDVPEYDRSKGEYLGWLGKEVIFIDDDPANVSSAVGHGLKGVLIPRPWNNQTSMIDEALATIR